MKKLFSDDIDENEGLLEMLSRGVEKTDMKVYNRERRVLWRRDYLQENKKYLGGNMYKRLFKHLSSRDVEVNPYNRSNVVLNSFLELSYWFVLLSFHFFHICIVTKIYHAQKLTN